MAKDRERGDSDNTVSSNNQSKRPTSLTQCDSDSLGSDQAQYHQQQNQAQHQQLQQQHRTKSQKHIVGGGRLHARVPSSKALHKHNTSASTTKPNRRVSSPSPERSTSTLNPKHAASSEVKLSQDSSSTILRKNTSQTSLKRNRSHVEVGKRSKSSTQLKRSSSERAVNKLKHSKSQVHFDLGDDGQEDEWVDASSSASPYLSRRGSVNTSGQSSKAHGSAASSQAQSPSEEPTTLADREEPRDETVQHKVYLTSRLLQRTPSHSVTTGMSNETASVQAHAVPAANGEPATVEVGTPTQGVVGSHGKDQVTSRFIQNNGHISGAGSSFYTSGGSVPSTDRAGDGSKRPRSIGTLPTAEEVEAPGGDVVEPGVRDDDLTDEEDTGITSSAIATTARSRKQGSRQAPPAEKSRTQQKLNLQRASSSMEPVRHRHSGMGTFAAEAGENAGPLFGGAGYKSQDPRINRLLERTGVEYRIVRRYQDPVGRSLERLSQLPNADKGRRIPRPGTSGTTSGQGARLSAHGGGQSGLSQSFKDARDGGNGTSRRFDTPKRAFSSVRANDAGSSLESEAGAGRLQDGLSGSSLVNGEDDDGAMAILRSLWEKNPDLSASQD